jgi:PilZ domain
MPFSRNHPRTTDTHDLAIRLRTGGRLQPKRRVVNVSEGGVLIAGGGLEVGSRVPFELAAGSVEITGVAEVEHCTADTAGLRFLEFEASADRTIHLLIRERIRKQRRAEAAHAAPGAYLG